MAPDWIRGPAWPTLLALDVLPGFQGVSLSFVPLNTSSFWEKYMEVETDLLGQLPSPWNQLKPFKKLLVRVN